MNFVGIFGFRYGNFIGNFKNSLVNRKTHQNNAHHKSLIHKTLHDLRVSFTVSSGEVDSFGGIPGADFDEPFFGKFNDVEQEVGSESLIVELNGAC